MLEGIKELTEQFKFKIELEPKNEKILYLKFDDGRGYRLEHPGALAAARLWGTDSNSLTADCLEYFIKNCIIPLADSKTKVLTNETMDMEETLSLWLPLAWRFLRHGVKIIV